LGKKLRDSPNWLFRVELAHDVLACSALPTFLHFFGDVPALEKIVFSMPRERGIDDPQSEHQENEQIVDVFSRDEA
jgi:hypothetical protein